MHRSRRGRETAAAPAAEARATPGETPAARVERKVMVNHPGRVVEVEGSQRQQAAAPAMAMVARTVEAMTFGSSP